MLPRAQLAKMIDHTLLRPFATETDIRELCEEAVDYGFRAVSINPVWVSFCARLLEGTRVGIDACVAFPLGTTTARMKLEEAREAVQNGATEIDMMINLGALKSGYPSFVEREIAAVTQGIHGIPLKIILETSYLNEEEKVVVCEMALRAGAAYVQTCTGYGQGGAAIEDIRLMKSIVGARLGIKAAGGIRTYGDAMAFIAAGANIIGASTGIEILSDAPA